MMDCIGHMGMWTSDREIVSQRAGSERIKSFGVSRVSAEGHMANYQAASAQGKSSAMKSMVKNGAKGMSDMAGKAAR